MTLVTRPSAKRDGDLIRVKLQFHQKDLVKQVPGARWDKSTETWTVPLSWGALWSMKAVFGDNLEVDDDIKSWAAAYHTEHAQPALDLRATNSLDDAHSLAPIIDEIEAGSSLKLYPFQRVGSAFLATAKQALLADDMGVGKSPQTIRALQILHSQGEKVLPALIVAPNSMKLTWQKEFERWWPELKGRIVAVGGEGEPIVPRSNQQHDRKSQAGNQGERGGQAFGQRW